jgi:hypothetical protein
MKLRLCLQRGGEKKSSEWSLVISCNKVADITNEKKKEKRIALFVFFFVFFCF